MRWALAVLALGLSLAGCSSAAATAHHAPAQPPILSTVTVCQRLRADMARNGTYPDAPTVGYLAAHADSPALASDLVRLRTDLPVDNGAAAVWGDLTLISKPCYLAGVTITMPSPSF